MVVSALENTEVLSNDLKWKCLFRMFNNKTKHAFSFPPRLRKKSYERCNKLVLLYLLETKIPYVPVTGRALFRAFTHSHSLNTHDEHPPSGSHDRWRRHQRWGFIESQKPSAANDPLNTENTRTQGKWFNFISSQRNENQSQFKAPYSCSVSP